MFRVGIAWLLGLTFVSWGYSQDRPTKVRNDRTRVESEGFWIYNDLARGVAEAQKSGKPLLVVFRCIPCEACAQLDEQVVERDPLVQDLLGRFVCVRIVHANGMDLSQFQFDYDQSWAAFFLNADMTIYGRYGTRSHQTESSQDVSLEGFSKALAAALELHGDFPKNKAALAAKRGPPSDVKVPEEFAHLRGKYKSKLDYEGQVVQSCIHCHQVGESLRHVYRDAGKPVPDKVLYPYPHPKIFGLILDPKEKAKVSSVVDGSAGQRDKFRAGDEIVTFGDQPILSIADLQWVLHQQGDPGSLPAEVLRNGKKTSLKLTLDKGWRQRDNISWRATSWEIRRMTTGGLVFEDLPKSERHAADLPEDVLALRIKHVGQYGEHATGKQAGFQKGDIVIAVEGQAKYMTESDLMTRLLNGKQPGDKVAMTVLRGKEKIDLSLPMKK